MGFYSEEIIDEVLSANDIYDVISEPKCESDGLGRYTVTFENGAFSPISSS